jgi:hypothetical protein
MKHITTTLTAAVLALAAGGMAQAGGKPVPHHEPRYTDHVRFDRDEHRDFDRHERREYFEQYHNYCEYPCYDYCWCWYPSCEYPCYDYRAPYDYKEFKGYRGPFKVK